MLKKQIILCVLLIGLAKVTFSNPAINQTLDVKIVNTVKVQYKNYQQKIISTGSLIAIPGIMVKSEVSGRIAKIDFKSGKKVAMGAPLIEINSDILKPQLIQAKAELDLEMKQFDRVAKLFQRHFISESDVDSIKTKLVTDKSKVSQYEAELKQMMVTAPFDGTLGLAMVSLGDYVEKGQEIVKLNKLNPIYADFSIPETLLTAVAIGQTVLLSSDAYPQQVFEGKVVAFDSGVNQSNRTIMVRAGIPNKGEKLFPGVFVKAILLVGKPKKVMVIPQTAVIRSADENYVYKVQDGKAKKVKVILGESNADFVIINSGLQINDKVITSGELKVSDGVFVK
jgi:membrane fusion protein (multidrug efflux system)